MVVLNLRDDCVARTATNFRRGMTDKRFLELEITAWLGSKERRRQLEGEAYYDGDQAVLRRKRLALDDDGKPIVLEHLPNNRLVNNIYSKMVDQKTNYSFGRPFSFDTENKAYAAALSTVFGSRFRRTMHNIGEGAWIGGKSWVYVPSSKAAPSASSRAVRPPMAATLKRSMRTGSKTLTGCSRNVKPWASSSTSVSSANTSPATNATTGSRPMTAPGLRAAGKPAAR